MSKLSTMPRSKLEERITASPVSVLGMAATGSVPMSSVRQGSMLRWSVAKETRRKKPHCSSNDSIEWKNE